MSKVLITGGVGFIGLHLARYLASLDQDVDLLDNFSRGIRDRELTQLTAKPNVRLWRKDLLKSDALAELARDYDYIYHLAAILGVANVLKRPYNVLTDNVAALLSVIDFARRQKHLKRLVFASTSEVYAGTLEHFQLLIPTPESAALALTDMAHPRSSYMLSKLYGEALCHHCGIPFTIIRPHNIYGPRMGLAHVIPELLQRVQDHVGAEPLQVYSVDHSRTFCFIDDAIELIYRAAESNSCQNETLNIGNQQPEITIAELAKLILSVVGKNLSIEPLHDNHYSPPRRCPDMSKTHALTGYRAQVSLEEGLRRTYAWYSDNVFTATGVSAR